MELETPLSEVKGVGPKLAKKLEVLGLGLVSDLISFYPRRYDDYSKVSQISELRPGAITIKARIVSAKGRYIRRGMHITEAIASDETGSVRLVWFNQPYRASGLKPNSEYYISGEFELSHERFAIMNASAELASDFPVNTARILPVYPMTKGLTSKQLRPIVKRLVPVMRTLPDYLPSWIVRKESLMGYSRAIEMIHFPASSDELEKAKRRLGFDEIFALSLASQLVKKELASELAPVISFKKALIKQFVSKLPYKLTNDQRKVAWQIFLDLAKTQPMNRLIEGDVGSGKTVVASLASALAIMNGQQVALMAPTEILARQHFKTFTELFSLIGLNGEVDLLLGSQKPGEKKKIQNQVELGDKKMIIGTHALISEKVDFAKLGLVIIDEQHRFGVEQRRKLQKKAGHAVHTLSLTATPIPRSLALVVYGELDISVLAEKPPGRKPVETKIISPNSRAQLYEKIKQELDDGHQMFVVCPLISESEVLDVSSVEKVYEMLSKKDFKDYRVGLLHGQLKPADKDRVMADFISHNLDILVSTTVIEVGVDVPNASVMMIEAPERFGLAQIHQLRGRVGRGGNKAYCYLVMSDSKAPSRRLRALESSSDGFKLAELDLEIRGPGALYGEMQSGQLDLRVANLTDTNLIISARNTANEFIERGEKLADYPALARSVKHLQAITTLN